MISGRGFFFVYVFSSLFARHISSLETSPGSLLDLSFVAEPHGVVTSRDKTVTFDCLMNDAIVRKIAIEYKWYKNDHLVAWTNRRKLLQNGSLFMEGKLEEGVYHCSVGLDGIGLMVSRKARLIFSSSTSDRSMIHGISRDSTTVMLYNGDVAMLTCRNATGVHHQKSSPVKWLKDEHDIDAGSNPNYFFHSPDSMILEIKSVQFEDFGKYKCKSTDGGSDINLKQNSDASSYQGVGPRFVIQPGDTTALEGGVVVLFCGANGRDRNGKKPRLTWLKDGVTIDLSTDGHFSLAGESSLRIDGLTEEDGGLYTCRASNYEDSLDADANLIVQVPPKIRVRPRNVVVVANSDCYLTCDIYANPRPVVKWLKNGSPLSMDQYIEMVDGYNLRILGTQPSDSGVYQCIGENAAGNLQTAALLTVNQENKTHQISSSLPVPTNLVSSITSVRFVTLSWRLPDSSNIMEYVIAGYLVTWQEENVDRKRSMNVASLEANLQFLKPSTKYKVEVMSVDDRGFVSSPFVDHFVTFDEDQVPDPPTNFQVTVLSSTSVHLSWSAPKHSSNPNNPNVTTGYKIFYFDVAGSSAEPELTVTSTSHNMTLKKFRQYSFRVAAFNNNGQGSSTEEVTIITFSDVPSSPPQNFSLETSSASSILVRWEPPGEESKNGIITGYRIKYKASKDKSSPPGVFVTDGTQVFHSLTDLNKGTEYSIRVQAQTRNGTGPSTQWLQAQTLTHDLDETVVPGPPSSLRVRALSNTIMFSWTPPQDHGVMIRGYVVGYGIGNPDAFRQLLDAKQRYHTLKGLIPSSNYVVTLKAYNGAGEGPPLYDSVVTREEPASEPSIPITPPVGLRAIVTSSSAIGLMWTDSDLGQNQRVNSNRFYTVRYSPRHQSSKSRPKFINTTNLNVHIEELKPDTEYEFSVRIIKGKRQSAYSLSVFNRTMEASPATAPRDVTPVLVENRPTWVSLSWQPPRQSNGQITGYVVYYTTDSSLSDRDWVVVDAMLGDKLTTMIKDLSLETTYYFKVQARNSIGYSPMSSTVIFRTPRNDGLGGGAVDLPDDFGRNKPQRAKITPSAPPSSSVQQLSSSSFSIPANILWIVIGCLSGLAIVVVTIVSVLFCRRRAMEKEDVNRNGYMPANKEKPVEGLGSLSSSIRTRGDLKPPDLWTHGRNLEMKITDQGSSNDPDELTEMMSRNASSVDEDGNSDSERYRCANHHRAKLMPLEANSLREPYLISNGHLTSTMSRPNYPRTQYSQQQQQHPVTTPRVNVGLVSPSSWGDHQMASGFSEKPENIPSIANLSSQFPPPSISSLPNKSPLVAPPPQLASPSSKLQSSNRSVGHDVTSDSKSFTTEELCAEMANLEGLMKDLSAITQHEFQC